jgi:hypothetical protein
MNSDSINEYILWLEEFREIYKEYIDDPSKKPLTDIFTKTLGKFHKILSGNNTTSTEEDIIRLLKELVYQFSVVYDANESKNKSKKGPRKTDTFKQDIYERKIAKLKKELIANINNPKFENNFEKIVMFVAKKRQMIEFLKLTKDFRSSSYHLPEIEKYIYFEQFGKLRNVDLYSFHKTSHATHLIVNGYPSERQIKYKYKDNTYDLTKDRQFLWKHTDHSLFPELFQIMNELYSEFLTLANRQNNASKRDILPELYWLYMQTCPFERGSAAIGEILFSVLLRKHFGCDFLISNGWNENPLTIPDIHALHYELDHFKSIFWDQFTNCNLKKKSNNNNNRKKLGENNYFYSL